jgi:hypothetical protein
VADVLRLFGRRDGRDGSVNNRLVLPKSFAARGTNSEVLLKPVLFLFGQFTGGRNGAEL